MQNKTSQGPHMKGVGMLVGNFELNPLRRPIWVWSNHPRFFLTPKRDHAEIYTPKRDDEHPDPFPMLSPPRV